VRISDRIREIENAARQYAFVRQVVKVDETYYSVKYRVEEFLAEVQDILVKANLI
jgi:hypothetical protein